MIPVNLLGDAAAAEIMVAQAVQPTRPEKREETERFDRVLKSRLEAACPPVDPLRRSADANAVDESTERERGYDPRASHRRNRERFTPGIANEETDRTVPEKPLHSRHPDLGRLIDLTA